MLNQSTMDQLSAFIDGELSAVETKAVVKLLETSREARLYLNALEESRALLKGEPSSVRHVPEWSEVVRRSRALESDSPRRLRIKWAAGVILGSGGAFAALLLASRMPHDSANPEPAWMAPVVEMVETDLENTVPVVYRDEASGWTVVWVIEEPARGDG